MFLFLVVFHQQFSFIDARGISQTTCRGENSCIVSATSHANAIAAVKALTPSIGGTITIQSVSELAGPATVTGS